MSDHNESDANLFDTELKYGHALSPLPVRFCSMICQQECQEIREGWKINGLNSVYLLQMIMITSRGNVQMW
jgi:hypothetical protein